jgi:Ras family
MVKMIVGNKTDLVNINCLSLVLFYVLIDLTYPQTGRTVTREEGQQYAKRHSTLFTETSASISSNVHLCFEDLVHQVCYFSYHEL